MNKQIEEMLENKIELSKDEWKIVFKAVESDPSNYKYFSYLIGIPEQINLAELAMKLDPLNFIFIRLELGFIYDEETKKQYKNILKMAIQNDLDNMQIVVDKLLKSYYLKRNFDIKHYSLEDKRMLFNTFAYCYTINNQILNYLPEDITNNISFQLYMLDIFGPQYKIPIKFLRSESTKQIFINKLYNDYAKGQIDINDLINTVYFNDFNELLNNLEGYNEKTFEDFELKEDQHIERSN